MKTNLFKNGKIKVMDGTFAVVKAKKTDPNAFCSIIDEKEITVINDQNKIIKDDIIEKDMGWKIITLDIVFPLDTIGVTAKISKIMEKANISILPISAFSRDHFLVKEQNLDKAIKSLKELGLTCH